MESRHLIVKAILRCILLVVVARPEEVFNTTPPPVRTNFSCYGRSTGFYADVEANCRVYHTCDDFGNKFSYRCPEETAFRQDALICDHAHLVDCQATTYSKVPEENNERKETLDGTGPSIFKSGSLDGNNPHRSFSRSFQVIRKPDKSTSNKGQPGFVFSASVFLRDLDSPDRKRVENRENDGGRSTLAKPTTNVDMCNVNHGRANTKNDAGSVSTTLPPFFDRSESKSDSFVDRFSASRGQKPFMSNEDQTGGRRRTYDNKVTEPRRSTVFSSTNRYEDPPRSEVRFGTAQSGRKVSTTPSFARQTTREPSRDFLKVSFGNNRDYPYLETLRSIQANSRSTTTTFSNSATRTTSTTTEIPVHALTLSLKPLVPNELEYDPYYPQFSTSTEAYYTPSQAGKEKNHRTTTQPPWSSVHFEIPAVLPDLNTLEDLVDRRKLFYIPRIKPA